MTATDTIPALLSALDDVPDALLGDVLLDLADALEADAYPCATAALLSGADAPGFFESEYRSSHDRLARGLRLIGDRRPVRHPNGFGWWSADDPLGHNDRALIDHEVMARIEATAPGSFEYREEIPPDGCPGYVALEWPTRAAAFLALAEALAKECPP